MIDIKGENADNPVGAVMNGVLALALIDDDCPNGIEFSALNHDLIL